MDTSSDSKIKNGDSSNPTDSQDAAEPMSVEPDSEIKVGNVKDIQQSDMVNISKDFNKIKSAEVSVNSNFLFLRAGANALLPKTKIKKKPFPKVPPPVEKEEEKKDDDKPASPPQSDASDTKTKSKPKVERSPFYCNVCEVELNSEATYMTHIEGKKHQKKLDSMDIKLPSRARRTEKLQYMKIKEGCRIPRIPRPNFKPHMKPEFDKISEPCLGLQFISEIWLIDEEAEDIYFCSLCGINCGPSAIISHIVGFKHRLAYMKLYDAKNYEEVKNLTSKKSELTAVLYAHATKLEKRDGCGKVKVEVEVDNDYDYDNYGGPMSDIPLNPKNLHFLPSCVKMRFLEETLNACADIPPYLNRDHVTSLNFSLQNLKAAIARYSPLDNLFKRRVLQFLEYIASLEKECDDACKAWKKTPSSAHGREDYMRGPVSNEQLRGRADYMYNPSEQSAAMGHFGPMNRNYPMNPRQNSGFIDDSMDIPPFPYGNEQQPPQSTWGPFAASGNRYNQYPGRGGQKRLYSERGDDYI